jgi:MOSC domain-containing protein YiiM
MRDGLEGAFVPGVESLNVGPTRPMPWQERPTGIDKRPVDHPVLVQAPGPKGPDGGSGLAGDGIGDIDHHGGVDQAVYAYAREDLDHWEAGLGRSLPSGVFGENLTTRGIDVNGAVIGERWRVGGDAVLQVTTPRTPCRTFADWLRLRGWVRRFTLEALPGAYLRVVHPGHVSAGDPVVVEHRPDSELTVSLVFRALTTEHDLLPLLDSPHLPDETRERARRRLAVSPRAR